jgi:hypothetical protein
MLLEFKELIAVYPYASIFAIAYLEGLKHSGDIHFEGELLKHAFKISNRQVLHQHLSQEQAPVEETYWKADVVKNTAPEVNVPWSRKRLHFELLKGNAYPEKNKLNPIKYLNFISIP